MDSKHLAFFLLLSGLVGAWVYTRMELAEADPELVLAGEGSEATANRRQVLSVVGSALPSERVRQPVDLTSDAVDTVAIEPVRRDLSECFAIDDPANRAICVREFLATEGDRVAERIGQLACAASAKPGGARHASSIIATCMHEWAHANMVEKLDQIQAACPGFMTNDLIKSGMLELQQTHPESLQALREELLAGTFYSQELTGMGVVLAAEVGLALGDMELAHLLASGATGELGGTAKQVDMSALVVVRLLEDPGAILELIDSVVASPSLPGARDTMCMGSSLIHILLVRRVVESQSSEAVVATAVAVLDSWYLGPCAAAHILDQQQSAPRGISQAAWDPVVSRARSVRNR